MQGERGVAHRGRGGEHLRMIRDGGAVDLRDGLAQLLARRGDVRARGGHRIARMRELFGGDGAVRDAVRRGAASHRPRCAPPVRAASICARSSLLCANRPRTWRTARARSASALATAIFASAGSSSSSGWPALHELGVVHIQRQHRARDFARHLHHIAVDVGIVGAIRSSGRRGTSTRRSRARRSTTAAPRPKRPARRARLGDAVGCDSGVTLDSGVFMGLLDVKTEGIRSACASATCHDLRSAASGRRGDRSCRRRRAAASPARPPGSPGCRPWTGARRAPGSRH